MTGKEDLLNDDFYDLEISKFLATYTVNPVEDKKIDETIDVLRAYMPKEKDRYQVLKLIKNEITYVNKIYWCISMSVIILGFVLTQQNSFTVYETLLYISPIPLIIGMYEVERGKRGQMWELEKSFKYSYSKIMVTKILIIMSFTTVLNIILSAFLCVGQDSNELIRVMTVWIAPISIVFLTNVIVSYKISSHYSTIITSALWSLTLILGSENIINLIEGATVISLITTIGISMVVIFLTIIKFYNDAQKYEGELSWS